MCRAAGSGDDDLQTVGTGTMRELAHQFRGAVRGNHLLHVRHFELVKHLAGMLHGFPIARRPHNHCDFRLVVCHQGPPKESKRTCS
jgi:hypothetical protein